MSVYFLIFLVSLLPGIFFTWMVQKWALKFKIMNEPNGIVPGHKVPVPYLGGVGIFLGILFAVILLYFSWPYFPHPGNTDHLPVTAIVVGGLGYTLWGLYDDLKVLKALPKFAGQVIVGITAVSAGLTTHLFNNQLDNILSLCWILFMVNAVNFTDVCDGLVASIISTTFLTLGIFRPGLLIPALIISGAVAGFLFFNSPKASIYLGDAGSHLLGFLLAVAGITASHNSDITGFAIWLALLSGLPLFELIFITTVRIRKGIPWWKGSPDHFSIRLQRAGFAKGTIDFMAVLFTAGVVTTAGYFHNLEKFWEYILLVAILGIYALFWSYLLKWEQKEII